MVSFEDISVYSILLPGGMAFYTLTRRLDTHLKWVKAIVLIALFCELVTFVYINWLNISEKEKNNMFVFHFFILAETVILILYFRSFLRNRTQKIIYFLLMTFFIGFHVLDLIKWESIKDFPSIPSTIECILLILLSILFFIRLFNESDIINLVTYPHFWMVSGLLLFFAGTFFMNIVGNLTIKENNLGFNIYDIHSYLNIFLNIIYTITLWLGSRRLVLAR